MSEENKRPQFRLKKREVEEITPEEIPKPQTPEPPKSLKLGQAYENQPEHAAKDQTPSVETYLENAYGKDRMRARQQLRRRRIRETLLFCSIMIVMVLGTLFYAHILRGWPIVTPSIWYLPFAIVATISGLLVHRGLRIFIREKSVSMLVFGILAACALTYWNVLILETTAKIELFSPSDPFWRVTNKDRLLRIYEINVVRTGSTGVAIYSSLSQSDYIQAFREMPKDEWRPHFQQYLTADELDRVSVTNIEDLMRTVTERMRAERSKTWNDFNGWALNEPSFLVRLKRWLIRPYTFVLEKL